MFIKSYKSDLTESITLITATMKLDLSTLVERGLSWDDRIPMT